jgi:hypothetical protein
MSEERHFETFALQSSLDVKFVNIYQKNTACFNTNYKSSEYISNRSVIIDHHGAEAGRFVIDICKYQHLFSIVHVRWSSDSDSKPSQL